MEIKSQKVLKCVWLQVRPPAGYQSWRDPCIEFRLYISRNVKIVRGLQKHELHNNTILICTGKCSLRTSCY